MEPVVFKHENYNIASDIRLEADVAYIQGQPIVKTKTVVLYYRGATFRASVYGSSFQRLLSMDVIRPQYTVELINYLSRLINHDNLFEIYVNNRNAEKYSLEELTFVKQENDEHRGPTVFDKSEYSEGLLDDHDQFILKELLKTLNTKFSRTFNSIDELNYVPVYGYISSSSSISRTSEPILHLAIVFNVLAHQDRFSGINNQEAIASFNSIMKAKRLNITTQDLNEHEYKNEIKRLKLELKREQQRAKGLEIKNKTLEEKIEEMNSKLDAQTQALNEANTKLDASAQREQQLITQNEHTHQELEHANAQRDELQTAVNGLQNTIDKLHDVIVDSGQMLHDTVQAARDTVLERFTQANVTTSSRLETIDVWRIKELDDYYHQTHQCQENESVLDTFCGDASKSSRINQHRFKPKEDDEFIGSYPNANAIDLALYLRRHHDEYPHVRMDKNRKLIYSDDELDEVRNLLLAYSQNGDGVIRAVVHGFETRYQEASDSLINRLQTALQPIIQNQNQILANQQAHHQEQMQAVANINANIDNAVNEIEEHVDEAIAPIIALFYQLHPNATQVYYNHAYRLLIIQNDKIYCHILKSSNQLHELTEEELHKLRFK